MPNNRGRSVFLHDGGTSGPTPEAAPPPALVVRDLIERHVARVIVTPQALEVCLNSVVEEAAQAEEPSSIEQACGRPPITIKLPWVAPSFVAVKGILHAPSTKPAISPEKRDALLAAIAKARGWVEAIRLGRFASFAEIAKHEAQGERHIRLLAPLAFLSPRIIAAIVDGTAPPDLTVTADIHRAIAPSPPKPRTCEKAGATLTPANTRENRLQGKTITHAISNSE